ncbi:MAG: hypothetical protein J0H17_11130 [Rhizobiales bacterium]|nr:hypothetical protein [Hyphomicrobiales bacterium]
MAAMLFCNIGWMSRYEGLVGKPDKIVGGGKWVTENKTGHEVCNFVFCRDGYVYGHVETIQGERDRKIRIEAVGGNGNFVEGIDVVWTATDPDEGGRKVVGWYRNATVFRERQLFAGSPSKQHARDEISSYRVRASAKDARRLDLEKRTLAMGRGPGWMGHTPWWTPSDDSPREVRQFVKKTRDLLDGLSGPAKRPNGRKPGRNSPAAASDPYLRYVEAYEVRITPRHSALQAKFERFLATDGATEIRPNMASVDLRYRDAAKGTILAEIKPCERANVRYAIRTAIGQLLDYRQRAKEDSLLLIVVEAKPKEEDRLLATSNGFGIAYPVEDSFKVLWPTA